MEVTFKPERTNVTLMELTSHLEKFRAKKLLGPPIGGGKGKAMEEEDLFTLMEKIMGRGKTTSNEWRILKKPVQKASIFECGAPRGAPKER